MRISRNLLVRLLAATVMAVGVSVLTPGTTRAEPITLSIIDTGGDLASTEVIIRNYAKANPDKVKDIKIQRAPAPELPAKIKAQQDAGRLDINLVLTGQDGGSLLALNKQIIQIPNYKTEFPRDILTDAGKALYDEGDGYLIPSVGNAGGPVFIYNPSKVPNPPKTAADLLAWAKANPGKFMYARPANSGPGRSILQGMSFILNDSKPMDPEKGWEKGWDFLKELGKSVEYYPTGTAITLKEFAQGQRWMIAGIMEWDMKPRAQSVIPPDSKIAILENTTFVVDGHYWAIPTGVPKEQVDVILDLMKFMWKPEQQVLTWTAFIGPVVKSATIASAPKNIQDDVKEFWRPEYDQ
ncbi:MAG: extracellular solute-binding protein, partial [Pseudolabrys sp.]